MASMTPLNGRRRKRFASDILVQGMIDALKTAPAPDIPGFEILERLGEGGMGVVYKARQSALDRVVAVKVLRNELAQEEEYIRRFLREARLAGRLRHANIVSALDCGNAGGTYFMVMEFVEGKPLDRVLKSRGALPEPEALEIARGIADALQHAWYHRVIHRDLKPQNVLLTKEGLPKVCDFGLCRDVRDLPHLTSLGLIHCTPEYSSPEQSRGDKDIDVRADLYSLGVTLYEMLTGTIPFQAGDPATMMVMHAMERPRPPVERNREITPATNQLVLDLLEKAKEERPAAPAIVLERIKSLSTPKRSGNTTTARSRNTRSWRNSSRRGPSDRSGQPVIAGILVAAALLVLGAVWGLRSRPEPRPPEPVRARPQVEPPEVSGEELRRQNLSRVLRAFETDSDGTVNHWLVLPNPGDAPVVRLAEGTDPIPGVEFARTDGTMARWMRFESGIGTLDFGEDPVALAACWLECQEEVSVEIQFQSSGLYEIQLDHRVLVKSPSSRDSSIRQKIVLGRGWHNLLVKMDRLEGRLTAQMRILAPGGGRASGIRVWH
jgi:serine/threonine protein kinase